MRAVYACLILLSSISMSFAQSALPIATNYKHAYNKQTRDKSGAPGKNYWQNMADYDINVQFDPATNLLKGSVQIIYLNESPDTLRQVVFKLYPNMYQAQAQRNFQIAPEDMTSGVDIKTLTFDSTYIAKKQIIIRGTNMYLKGVTVLPGKTAKFNIDYSYQINKGSFNRTGQVDTGAYVIAYFFPRIAVYDDIEGWNQYPYIGKEEFYNDYCNFKAAITLPGSYAVWATGNLVNENDVYQPEIVKRIQTAKVTDSITSIIRKADIDAGVITRPARQHTWRFEANNVTDFTFAAGNHYVWKAASIMVDAKSKRRTLVNVVYNPDHHNFDPVIQYARRTVELISYKVPALPFPYPHETIFEGLDATEYPMMVNNMPFEGKDAVQFTAHEVFHSLFPFWVGNNETKHSFMDEGFATFAEFTFGPLIGPDVPDTYDMSYINGSAGNDQDVPIMTLTPQLYGAARFSNKDLKPALGLRYIRELLGDKVFNKAVQYYINEWAGKHPSPYDFFNCINKGAGQNLNWFWINWYFEKFVPDLAISHVAGHAVTITKIGKGVVPVHLYVLFKNGTSKRYARSIDCWKNGNTSIVMKLPAKQQITEIRLGTDYDADVNKSNNNWKLSRGNN